jgi:hypothetical protein
LTRRCPVGFLALLIIVIDLQSFVAANELTWRVGDFPGISLEGTSK